MMADRRVLRQLRKAVKDTGASPRERKALYEAALVESGARDLDYGDRDSIGVLQQRPSQGWKSARGGPYAQAREFLRRAKQIDHDGMTAGQLAQAIQRSAFPDRYDKRGKDAERLAGKGDGRPAPRREPAPGGNESLMRAYLSQRGKPGALLDLARGMTDSAPGRPSSKQAPRREANANTSARGADFAKLFGLKHTSGYRDPAHNAAVGGVRNSAHTQKDKRGRSLADDYVGSAEARKRAARAAKRSGATQVLEHDAGSGMHLHIQWGRG